MAKEWHSRGYIPHWERGEVVQSITFRLADSLPREVLERWTEELANLPNDKAEVRRRARIESALDRGHGEALLLGDVAELIEHAILYFDAQRYRAHAWVIMPNHVHVLITPATSETLSAIVHSWKSFTAKKANLLLKRSGAFWSREYFDRAIRDEAHYANALAYIAMNPVKVGLCHAADDWRFSSAWRGRKSRQDAGAPGQE